MSYNGWTNKETWLVNLWMGDYFQDLASDGEFKDLDRIEVADRLEQLVTDYADETVKQESGLIADFLNMCLAEIDFDELARHLEEDEEEEEAAA